MDQLAPRSTNIKTKFLEKQKKPSKIESSITKVKVSLTEKKVLYFKESITF